MDSEPPQRWADVPDESKQQLLELANRPGVVDSKGRRWQPRQLMAEFGLTRRQATVAIAVLASGATLGSALQHAVGVAAGAASETDSDGDVGQKSDRVDVFADGVDANSVSTDEILPGASTPGDVSGSRSLGTWYQNTSGKFVFATVQIVADGNSLRVIFDLNNSQASQQVDVYENGNSPNPHSYTVTASIPPDQYYRVDEFTGNGTIRSWFEYNLGA